MRDAPSLAGAEVHAYETESMEQPRPLMPETTSHDNAYAVATVTGWDAFRALDLDRAMSLLKTPILVDPRTSVAPAIFAGADLRMCPSGGLKADVVHVAIMEKPLALLSQFNDKLLVRNCSLLV